MFNTENVKEMVSVVLEFHNTFTEKGTNALLATEQVSKSQIIGLISAGYAKEHTNRKLQNLTNTSNLLIDNLLDFLTEKEAQNKALKQELLRLKELAK